jgi:hypothetical protein
MLLNTLFYFLRYTESPSCEIPICPSLSSVTKETISHSNIEKQSYLTSQEEVDTMKRSSTFWFFLETRSCYVAQTGLKLMLFLLYPPTMRSG